MKLASTRVSAFGTFVMFFLLLPLFSAGLGLKKEKIIVACIGDSITFGARVEERDTYSYPARLQLYLGEKYHVENFGLGSCTLIRKGKPNVWSQLTKIMKSNPDIVVVILGTNDTVGGSRKCWDHKNDFPQDYRDLIDTLRTFPSIPEVYICAPSPMVTETPGLDIARLANLQERQPRLQELITLIKNIAVEKKTHYIDLNTPMADKPKLFTVKDGVHPNKAGYLFMAELVYNAIRKSSWPAKGS